MIACMCILCLREYISVGMLYLYNIFRNIVAAVMACTYLCTYVLPMTGGVCVNQFAGLDELQTQEYRGMEHRKCAIGLHWWNI